MTKKDYEAIAKMFHPYTAASDGIRLLGSTTVFAAHLIEYMEKDNPNFDRLRFMKAAGFALDQCEAIHEVLTEDDESEYYVTPSGIQRDVCCEHDGNGCGH